MKAPAIKLIETLLPSIITYEVQTGDAINGYGVSKIYDIRVAVIGDNCRLCGESSYTAPYNPDRRLPSSSCQHRWKSNQQTEIAYCSGKTLEEVTKLANKKATDWLLRVVHKSPEMIPGFMAHLLELIE